MVFDLSNQSFKTAVAFVNGTGRHLFITGKAGTGKTTFLKYIRDHSQKKMAIVAPTGVAAINAGGVTMHSFFQLPFGAFVPGGLHGWNAFENGVNNRDSLLKNLRLPAAKRDVIRELELLVIDEVSMVRADLLDAVDTVLRHVRRQPHLPFGGVQMLYIGDLFQLPPVVNNTEWDILKEHYRSPFFFDAKAIAQATPVYIELKKIYRQSDDVFINLLNNVRNNCCTAGDLAKLHTYYQPGFTAAKDDGYITLTSHNAKADHINRQELDKTPGPVKKFEAVISGDFPDKSFPAENVLHLKTGAQVMFIKNDKEEDRRYYNGKLATISRFEGDKIFVVFSKDGEEMELEKEVWRNVRYEYNKEEDDIEEEEMGTFSQYPIRLAWAITIHKSQGLTFEKAIIDAGSSFAPGQVYVALSRLTSLNGLVLLSKIHPSSISTDRRIQSFADMELAEEEVTRLLAAEQKTFMQQVLVNSFSWHKMLDEMDKHIEAYAHRQIPDKTKAVQWAMGIAAAARTMQDVADKFSRQLESLFAKGMEDAYRQLHERTAAATAYFTNELDEKLLKPVDRYINEVRVKPKVKKYVRELQDLQRIIQKKQQQVKQAAQLAGALYQQKDMDQLLQLLEDDRKTTHVLAENGRTEKTKLKKGDSGRLSLEMFKAGKSIADIATERSLTFTTIQGHLSSFIQTGEVDILDLVNKEKLHNMLVVINENMTQTAAKELLGPDYSYGEIRAAFHYLAFQKQLSN